MKNYIILLALLLSPIAFGSSAVNPANTGNSGGVQFTNNVSFSASASVAGFGTVGTSNIYWHREGQYMHILGYVTPGTPGASALSMVLPGGYTIDTTVVTANKTPLGTAQGLIGNMWTSLGFTMRGFYDGADATKVFFGYTSGSGSYSKANGNDLVSTGNAANFDLKVPISGWAAGGSNPSGVAARYHASSTSLSGSLATIVWTTSDWDTNSAMSSGVFTCPQTGKYQVNAFLGISGTFVLNNTVSMELQVNSTAVATKTEYAGGAITNADIGISDTVNCATTSDTIRIQVSSSATGPAIVSSNVKNWISISKVSN
jgi:hypothetical protein